MPNSQDPSNFHRMIVESPDQFSVGFNLAKNIKVPGKFENIVISGMGGSALPGNLLRVYLNDDFSKSGEKPIGIYQNRFYVLPPQAYDRALNIICSYSGNTEETIASFNEALDHKLPCIGVSSGGEIEKICKKNNIPHIKLPVPYPNFQPRVGTGYFFAVLLQILINQGLVSDNSQNLLKLCAKLKKEMPDLEKEAKQIAKEISGKTPVFFSTSNLKALPMIWKIKFNENSKTPAFWNYFPELNHNEMIGYTNPQSKFFILMLRDPDDYPKNINRFEATAIVLRKQGIEVKIMDLVGDNLFTKMFRSLAIGDLASYFLALEYKQDPTPVKTVEELKKMLAAMH